MGHRAFKVFDLFAGAGGFGLGFEMAGYKLELSIEKDEWAADTLRANHNSSSLIIQSDIRNYNNIYMISGVTSITPDIIIGGPPCQGFSLAGPQKDPSDPRNTLFNDFSKWVEFFNPSLFVMENVTGLLNRKNSSGENVIQIIRKTFENVGYHTDLWVLNAANYGVPQIRNRIFIVGNKLNKQISPPSITHFVTEEQRIGNRTLLPAIKVSTAISDLPNILAGEGDEISNYSKLPTSNYQRWARQNSKFVFNHVAMKHSKRLISRYTEIIAGTDSTLFDESIKVRKRNGQGALSDVVYQSNYRHLKPDQISYTIPASFYSNFVHPRFPRNITSREAARLQSFPDWYVFKGKRTQISSKLLALLGKQSQDHLSQYNQIGNAVPPLLAKAIAEHLKQFL